MDGSSVGSDVRKAGGIVGDSLSGSINFCWASGNIINSNNTGAAFLGGISGDKSGGIINSCVALNSSISGTVSTTGRIVSRNNGGALSNNYAKSDMSVNGSTINIELTGPTYLNGANVDSGTGAGRYNNETFWSTPGYVNWSSVWGGPELSVEVPWKWSGLPLNLPVLWFE